MKKKDLLNVWSSIRDGKFGKMSGEAKIKFVKLLAKLSPVVKAYEEYQKTIVEKLKEEYQDFDARLEKARAYEEFMAKKSDKQPDITDTEYKEIVKDVQAFNKAVADALNEEADKEVDVTFDKLTSTEYGCFIDSNDFTGSQALQLMEIICDLG